MSRSEIRRQPREDNRSSWQWMIAFYDEVIESNSRHRERYEPINALVVHLANTPYADKFRAGQCLDDLRISTKDRNGLEENDPFIDVASNWKTGDFQVQYWRGEYRGGLVEGYDCVSGDDLLKKVEPLLARLWQDTKGSILREEMEGEK